MSFSGFPPETLGFLRRLRKSNTREWFDDHRAEYEAYYLAPAREFVVAAVEAIRRFSPEVAAVPKINGSIRRINRDVGFSPDKTP